MRKLAAVLTLFTLSAFASDARVAAILDQFSKTKHKTKEHKGVKVERYRNIEATPLVKANPAAYSGRYAVQGLDFDLELTVASNGVATGSGVDEGRPFTLRNGRVEGVLLTATKVYRNGRTEPLEGAFITQRVREGTSPQRITYDHSETGLGVTGLDVHIDSINLTKLFYRSER